MKKPVNLFIFIVIICIIVIGFNIHFFGSNKTTKISSSALKELQKKYENSTGYQVMVVFGTRPEVIKMAPVIEELKNRKEFSVITVSTGQHKELLYPILSRFNLEVDIELNVMVQNQNLNELTVSVLEGFSSIFDVISPDIVLVQGDTTTSYAASVASFYRGIPVGHVEAGLRTWNIDSPFPEEMNRQSIGILAKLNFVATETNAVNLLRQGKQESSIYVTGNPVVDSLKKFATFPMLPSTRDLIEKLRSSIPTGSGEPRVILLTAHRRENHGRPLENIMQAILEILELFPNICVVYPVHPNPQVRNSIKNVVPLSVYETLPNVKRKLKDPIFDRLHLISPVEYPEFLFLMMEAYIILTDSGGIQEEAVSLGKPILVLRSNTERPEGVQAGVAKLVGTEPRVIIDAVKLLLQNPVEYTRMSSFKSLYGSGTSSKQIADILLDYLGESNYSREHFSITYKNPTIVPRDELLSYFPNKTFDVIMLISVWRRNTLDNIFKMLSAQTIMRQYSIKILVFQSANHIDVSTVVEKWKQGSSWIGAKDVSVEFIHSKLPTGYYGRFMVPLLSDCRDDSYFFVLDDDLIWGSKYFENSIRVINDGYLSTRNGRFIEANAVEGYGKVSSGWSEGVQVTWDIDVDYDFGGQTWGGRIRWLKLAWKHPSPTFANCEDFWLSAVLKTYYGIRTRVPSCPNQPGGLDYCACSIPDALNHVTSDAGSAHAERNNLLKMIRDEFKFIPMKEETQYKFNPEEYKFHRNGNGPFNLTGTFFENCLFFV